MQRILILDAETPLRAQLVAALQGTPNTDIVLASTRDELIMKVGAGLYAAVLVDAELLDSETSRLIDAVRSAILRPMLIVASNEKAEDLDPDLVTLVVRKPYDVKTLVGILSSAVTAHPAGADGKADSPSAG